MASFVWTLHDNGFQGEVMRYWAIAITVIVALLMVSNLRYTSFKGRGGPQGERVPFWTLLLVVAALIALALYPPETLLIVFGLYALSGPVMALVRRRRSNTESV